ncbi:MAG: hypothetical protein WA642_14430, partial [Steroidobacteraceae bacterium]
MANTKGGANCVTKSGLHCFIVRFPEQCSTSRILPGAKDKWVSVFVDVWGSQKVDKTFAATRTADS